MEDNNVDMTDTEWMGTVTGWSSLVASELWSRYGSEYSDQIAGFYLPLEGDNLQFSTDPSAGAAYTRYANLLDYTRTVSEHLRSVAGDTVRIMTSPYHVASSSSASSKQASRQTALQTYRSVVAGLTTGTGVTTYAPQDNLGAGSDPAAAAAWMAAARMGIDDARAKGSDVELWANIEQYSMQGEGSQSIGQLLSHMDDVNAPATIANADVSAGITHFVGFSLASFSTTWYLTGQSAGLRAAYAHYLANPESSLKQVVPSVSNLTATAVASSLDVSVQWTPVAAMPTPAAGVAAAPVLGYVVFRDGIQIAHVEQRFTSQKAANGFYAVDTSRPAAFTDPSVPTGRTFTYEVAAFDSYGNLSARSQVDLVVPMGAADVLSANGGSPTGAALRVSDNSPYSAVVHNGNPENIWDAIGAGDGSGAYVDGSPVAKAVDGHLGEARYEDPAWVGLGGGTNAETDVRTVEVGLPTPVAVHAVRTHWLSDRKVGVSAPDPESVSVSTRSQAAQIDGTAYERLNAPAEISSGLNPDGTKAGTVIPNPGTGWYTDSLLGADARVADSVRVSVAPTAGDPWAFLSEIQVLTAAGKNVCDQGGCTARVLTLSGEAPTTANRYVPTSGRTLTGAAALRSADGSLAPQTYPWDVPSRSVGWKRSSPFDLVLDLGVDRPIGQVASDWFNTGGGAKSPAVSMFLLRDNGGSVPDLTATASWLPLETSRNNAGTVAGYTGRPPSASTSGGPVYARWIKLVVTPTDMWSITTNLTVTTPTAVDAARCDETCGPPRLYKTSADTSGSVGAAAPLTASGAAVALECRPTGSSCATDNSAGASTLTRPMPATDNPDYAYIRANGLTLRSSPSWDVVAPLGTTTGAGTPRVAEPTISMVYSPDIGSVLPASIDLYTASSDQAPATTTDPDGSRSWRFSGVRAARPTLPTYVPSGTAFIYTYAFPAVTADPGERLEALRFHLNTRGQQAIATRVQAGVWP